MVAKFFSGGHKPVVLFLPALLLCFGGPGARADDKKDELSRSDAKVNIEPRAKPGDKTN